MQEMVLSFLTRMAFLLGEAHKEPDYQVGAPVMCVQPCWQEAFRKMLLAVTPYVAQCTEWAPLIKARLSTSSGCRGHSISRKSL